jgi:two-component system chemotaxis response regulator CheB
VSEPIKIIVVDDSASVRQTLAAIIGQFSDFSLIAAVGDPYQAVNRIAQTVPDVIILDIEMPKMDGLTFLHRIMTQHPIPTIICSSLAVDGSDSAMKALAYGAVEIITKPKIGTKQYLEEAKIQIYDAILAAAQSKLKRLSITDLHKTQPKLSADAMLSAKPRRLLTETTEKVIVIGASTGGTEALRIVLEGMPMDAPGIVIVQHMPENFTRSFAQRLDSLCKIEVKEAADGDPVLRGQALIAPGNLHTLLKRSGANYLVEVKSGPLVTRHRPSVDVLFRSAAVNAGKNAIGVIMTGMGDDGAGGLRELKDAGAFTVAQDEDSCVVFGMPKEAIKRNAVDRIVPLTQIAELVYNRGVGRG